MKLLFVCNQGKNRSRTARDLFKGKHTARSAGLYNALPISKRDLDWADTIFVMESAQRKEISIRFPKLYLQKKIIDLDISDIYSYNQPELVSLLKEKMERLL